MAFQITPASAQDAEDLARLIILGGANDKMFNRVVLRGKLSTPAQQAEQLRWRTARNALNMQRRGTHWFKAVDTLTSETVGFVGAVAPKSEESAWDGTLCGSIDAEWFAKYMKATTETKEALLEGREDVWYIPAMVVHPDYQGRGIGTRLLAEICVLADQVGQDVYLESSPVGTKLYLSSGFVRIGDIDLQGGDYVLGCMLRKASVTV